MFTEAKKWLLSLLNLLGVIPDSIDRFRSWLRGEYDGSQNQQEFYLHVVDYDLEWNVVQERKIKVKYPCVHYDFMNSGPLDERDVKNFFRAEYTVFVLDEPTVAYRVRSSDEANRDLGRWFTLFPVKSRAELHIDFVVKLY